VIKMVFKITYKEFLFALAILTIGLVMNSRMVILFFNSLSPLMGFLFSMGIFYSVWFILSRFKLILWNMQINKPLQVLGLALITTAFFMVINMESCYDQYVVYGSCDGVTPIYFQSEDGAVFNVLMNAMPTTSLDFLALLTYGIIPFLLTLFGVVLVKEIRILR